MIQPFDLLVEDEAACSWPRQRRQDLSPRRRALRAMLLTRFDAQQITAMLGAGSMRYFAASNPAHVCPRRRGLAADGQFLSDAKDAGTVAAWAR